jgi:hypothetical protein
MRFSIFQYLPNDMRACPFIRVRKYCHFFFLLRPREYYKTSSHTLSVSKTSPSPSARLTTTPLPFLSIASCRPIRWRSTSQRKRTASAEKPLAMAPPATPPRARFASSVAVSYTYDSLLPPPDTPLCALMERHRWRLVPSTAITAALRACATDIGHTLGLQFSNISARALRAGGAMALLLGKVDYATIQLIGRWRSD